MDKLKKRRAAVRTIFTKSCDQLEVLLAEEVSDVEAINAKWAVLEQRHNELILMDREMSEKLFQTDGEDKKLEEKFISELETVDTYDTRYFLIKSKVEYLNNCQLSINNDEERSQLGEHKTMRYPKLEFVKYSGEVSQWVSFWAQFSCIDKDKKLSKEIKFQYLIQATAPGSRARSLVESFPPSGENYNKALETLKERFGRKELLSEYYVRELIKLVNNYRGERLSSLYDKLETQLRALETLKIVSDSYSVFLFPLIESCLPSEILKVWQRSNIDPEASFKTQMESLMLFLKKEVENEERMALVNPIDNIKERETNKEDRDTDEGERFATAVALANLKIDSSEKRSGKETVSALVANEVDLLSVNHSFTVSSPSQDVYLQTFLVTVRNGSLEKKARVLIDCGSQKSYITKKLVRELRYDPVDEEEVIHSLFGGNATGLIKHYYYKIHLLSLKKDFACAFHALDQEVIAPFVPTIPNPEQFKEELIRSRIQLAVDAGGPIDILIGADVAGKLWSGGKKTLSSGLVAMQTSFGWTLMGSSDQHKKPSVRMNMANVITMTSIAQSSITDLWKLETIGIVDPAENKKKEERNIATLEHFKKNVCFTDGRYEVRLPWREDAVDLENNKEIAVGRLLRCTKRMKINGVYKEYDRVLQGWLESGIIEFAEESDQGHFLPHRPVIKTSSRTTRVRPVFDASAKTGNNASLNDCLEEGPNLIELLPAVLMRFREGKVGVSADIEKAFLQISIHADDRKYLKFFWWREDSSEELITFRHARVVFGIKSSPFLLGAVLDHHIEMHLIKESGLSSHMLSRLKEGFYVDNLVTSLESLEDAEEFRRLSCEVMKGGGFNLREWEFTDEQALSEGSTILGIKWYRNSDTLGVNLDCVKEEIKFAKFTKRTVLSISQRVFDPIGFSVPALMQLKLLAQTLWEKKLDWDDPLEDSDRKFLEEWLSSLHLLGSIKINRCLGTGHSLTLHVFCDASKKAYASVIFARSEVGEDVIVELIQAKARIAPLKELTIPRLELLAVTIGARLLIAVKEALRWENVPVYVWTDSTTVLAWILRQEEWSIFVRNRVKEIRDLTGSATWKHIPGDLNPADLPSRGCGIKFLLRSKWWEGPPCLRSKPEEWPSASGCYEEEQIIKERVKKVTSNYCCGTEEGFSSYFDRFSQYCKIVRIVGWCKRFIKNALKSTRRNSRILCLEELEEAEQTIIGLLQRETFMGVSDDRVKTLLPFFDEKGLMRVKTKLVQREDTTSFRYPLLLPTHSIVRKLILEQHVIHAHAGTQTLLSLLREQYWILNGRKTVRSVINDCKICKRYSGKTMDTTPVSLTTNRVRDAKCFEVTGIDYAGPLILKGGEKAYICLFTCAIYRAVHLELVTSLTTDSFFQAFRRFINRRGRPSIVYSDNGTNFVGADNVLKDLDWDRIGTSSAKLKIKWFFMPPSAPWWGGWWERLVGLMKNVLRRVLGRASLTYEELTTTLTDCEALLNSRPLTYVQ